MIRCVFEMETAFTGIYPSDIFRTICRVTMTGSDKLNHRKISIGSN